MPEGESTIPVQVARAPCGQKIPDGNVDAHIDKCPQARCTAVRRTRNQALRAACGPKG
jgi:hypothetical protein